MTLPFKVQVLHAIRSFAGIDQRFARAARDRHKIDCREWGTAANARNTTGWRPDSENTQRKNRSLCGTVRSAKQSNNVTVVTFLNNEAAKAGAALS